MKNICVIGTGYVGLVTGTCFSDLGNKVTAIDINEEKIRDLNKGILPIYEPGLGEMVTRNVKAGRLRFTTSYADGLGDADFVFISVGTPEGVDGEADLQYVRAAAEGIAKTMDHPLIIVNKSTVPVGTGDWVADIVRKSQPKPIDFSVVSCPEFLREGSALADFMHPDRTVLGSTDRKAAEAVAQLFLSLRAPIVMTDLRTAEMIKYASNAFLATRISFINEISLICEKLGADVIEVAQGMGFDKRVGHHFLQAGIGYGGSCFLPEETVFSVNGGVTAQTLESLFKESGEPFQGETVEVVTPKNTRVLAFNLETGCPEVADVHAVTRRPYKGTMVTIKTSMGRLLTVTADHPVILHRESGFDIVAADEVTTGDMLVALDSLPALEGMLEPVRAYAGIGGVALGAFATRIANVAGQTVPLKVLSVENAEVETTVYSLETSTGTFIGDNNVCLHNCFPKDVKALAYMAQTHGTHPQLLNAVMEINEFQRKHVILKLHDMLGEVKGKTVALLGLAFKENTDDIRESPALAIASYLLEQGAAVRAYDPVAMEGTARILPQIVMCETPYEVAEGADALVVATPWNEFKSLDMEKICKAMKQPIMIDGRNMYEPDKMHSLGFKYRGVGRGYNGDGLAK